MKKILLSLVMAAVLATSATIAMAAPGGVTDSGALKDLAAARKATAKYHNMDAAIADGYGISPFAPCVSSPAGGMGFHYGNSGLVGDGTVNLQTPETLLYIPTDNGGRRLVGVEYHMDALVDTGSGPELWFGETPPDPNDWVTTAPSLFGQTFDGPMEGHGPSPWHYDLHVWLWQGNPSGIFADFNPNVNCS